MEFRVSYKIPRNCYQCVFNNFQSVCTLYDKDGAINDDGTDVSFGAKPDFCKAKEVIINDNYDNHELV